MVMDSPSGLKTKSMPLHVAAPMNGVNGINGIHKSAASSVLYRQLHEKPHKIVGSRGNYLLMDNGLEIFDATGGAAVACIGHANARVKEAMMAQVDSVAYCYSLFFTSTPGEKLAKLLTDSTNGQMTKVFIISSGEQD